jgi:septal ring factor EnvC (AmiA/AmiB activator)
MRQHLDHWGRLLPVVAVCAVAAGCATGPVNTQNPTTSQLLFRYDELNAYLDQRRSELEALRAQLARVSDTLAAEQAKLASARAALDRLQKEGRAEAARIKTLEAQTAQLTAQSSAATNRLADLNARKAELEQASSEADQDVDRRERASLQYDVGKLEREIFVLRNGVDNLTNAREIEMMRT